MKLDVADVLATSLTLECQTRQESIAEHSNMLKDAKIPDPTKVSIAREETHFNALHVSDGLRLSPATQLEALPR